MGIIFGGKMAIRLSTLAEIRVLSLSNILTAKGKQGNASISDITAALTQLKDKLGSPGTLQSLKNETGGDAIFRTVGIARSIRISEDYGTQNYYGIGAPTRPRIVPNNQSVSAEIQRIQLDTRDLNHYVSRPEYWYADGVQKQIGIEDVLLYTFLFIRSKEDVGRVRHDIYALMPRSSNKTISNGDVMIAHDVSMVGFKYSYEDAYFDVSNIINETITADVSTGAPPPLPAPGQVG
jgi:hypothetical protein